MPQYIRSAQLIVNAPEMMAAGTNELFVGRFEECSIPCNMLPSFIFSPCPRVEDIREPDSPWKWYAGHHEGPLLLTMASLLSLAS